MKFNINAWLHETRPDARCGRCGNKGHGELNLEGAIHHSCDVMCLDKKECRRRQRKNAKVGVGAHG